MSSSTLSRHAQMTPNDTEDTPFSQAIRSRRTPSFSSYSSSSISSPSLSSRSSSFHYDSPLFSPGTPLRSSGIPFSWEKLPGIPKNQLSKKLSPSLKKFLPLPPAATTTTTKPTSNKKSMINSNEKRDPFFAALIECSKDDADDEDQDSMGDFWKGAKVTRSISDRFGFIGLYTSCKRNCPVSESIIYVPRSRG